MSKNKSDYSGGGTSGGRFPQLSEVPETDTTASPDDSDGGATTQELADASRFNAPPSPTASSQYADGSTNNDVSELSSITGTSRGAAASASGAERSNEAEARRRSIRTAPGAFHVRPRRATDAEDEEGNQNHLSDDDERTADGQSGDTSGAGPLNFYPAA